MMRLLLVTSLYLISNIGAACNLGDADLAAYKMVELESDVTLHYRIDPSPLRVAQHFSMQFLLCRGQQPLKLDGFKVDALMPKHGHGMNYKADIEIQHDGLVEASGLLFHMPGQWQIKVDLSYDGLTRQVKIDYPI